MFNLFACGKNVTTPSLPLIFESVLQSFLLKKWKSEFLMALMMVVRSFTCQAKVFTMSFIKQRSEMHDAISVQNCYSTIRLLWTKPPSLLPPPQKKKTKTKTKQQQQKRTFEFKRTEIDIRQKVNEKQSFYCFFPPMIWTLVLLHFSIDYPSHNWLWKCAFILYRCFDGLLD